MTLTETPLMTDHYTALRGPHRTKWLVAHNPNTVVFKAQINQSSFPDDFAQVTYDNVTVGAYGDVREGWVVYFSHVDDIHKAYFRGRVHTTPTSNTLYLNQNSTDAQNNDFIFIVKDTALMERLPRKDGSTLKWDYSRTYNQLPPIVRNLPSVVAGRLTEGGVVDFEFNPLPLAPTSGATITGHGWVSDGGTFEEGSSSTQNVVIRFDEPGWYEVRYVPTDSAGRTSYFAIRCIVYPADYSSVIANDLICEGVTDEISVGWSAQIRSAAGDDLVDLLAETELVVIAEDWFGEERGSLISNIKFVGRVRGDDANTNLRIQNNVVQVTQQATLEVEGIGAQLGRLILASVTLRRKSAASVLGEIADLTLWRGMVFLAQILTTLTTVHALDFDDTSNDYAYPLFTAQDRSAESALSDVAFTINGFFNWSPDGRLKIARHMWFLNSTDKAALITFAAWQAVDRSSYTIKRDRVPRLGRVIAYGGTYNTASGTTLALRAKAPAVVWGPGEGRSQLNRQVLKANLSLAAAKTEIAVRAGAEYASKNLVHILEIKHPSGYDNVLSASVYQRYTHAIAATTNRSGFACDATKYWWLQRVQIRYLPFTDGRSGGYTENTASYIEDIEAVNAKIMAEIAPTDRPAYVPALPLAFSTPILGLPGLTSPTGADIDPDDEQPYTSEDAEATQKPPEKSTNPDKPTPTPEQHAPSKSGSVVAVSNGGGLWICEDFTLKAAPTWKNITPGSGITDFRFDPHSGGGWAITNDGTNSVVWRADNILNPSWRGTSIEGIYTQLRPTSTNGAIAIYSPETELEYWEVFIDFEVTDGDFARNTDTSYDSYGHWSGGSGWLTDDAFDSSNYRRGLDIVNTTLLTDPDTHITDVDLGFDYNGIPFVPPGTPALVMQLGPTVLTVINDTDMPSGTDLHETWSGDVTGATSIRIGLNASVDISSAVYGGSATAKSLRLKGTGPNPFGGGFVPASAVRLSADNGGTFGDALAVGDPTSDETGFDTLKVGSTIYAADEDTVRESSGGAFADSTGGETAGSYARALWAYGTDGTAYLMASATAVSSETLWTVIGGVKSAITPTDGGNDGLVVGPYALVTPLEVPSIFMLATFGGTVKLARSSNFGAAWAFTSGVSSGAKAVAAKNADQVYIANSNDVLYSEDGGATVVSKPSPGSSLTLIQVR